MKRILIFGLLCLTMGCEKTASPKAISPLSVVNMGDVRPPASATVTISPGSNLQRIASLTYGDESFDGFVAKLNGIADPALIKAGSILKTPSLPVALFEAGLDPHHQPAFNVLALCWQDLESALSDYESERHASSAKDGGSFQITPALNTRLVKIADQIDAAVHFLSNPKAGHRVPKSTLGKFSEAALNIRHFALGKVFSTDYEVSLTKKSFGLGFTYALIWAQQKHQ